MLIYTFIPLMSKLTYFKIQNNCPYQSYQFEFIAMLISMITK